MPASAKRLGDLHAALTETLIEHVQDKTVTDVEVDDDGKETTRVHVVRAAPAALAVAAKFLKDNSITADIEVDEKMNELRSKLGQRLPTKQDMKDAMAEIGRGLLN